MSNIQKQHKISPAIAWLTIQKFIIFYCPLDGEHTKNAEQLFGIELRSEADCEYPLDDNALSGNDWCLIWKMTKRTKQ